VRESSAADHETLASSLAAAFDDDPVAAWCIPPRHLRQPVLKKFFREYLRQKQRYDTVWCDDALTGAAVWAPPGKAKMGVRETTDMLLRVFHPRLAARGPMLGIGALAVERLQPPENDFFYLAALGVDPAEQGHGTGSKVLAPALEICDRDGVGAYLESSKESNIDFYARHGFRLTGEHRLPRGPRVYFMWRDPVGAGVSV
jgi:ribosomal protein S18 acetylase RimI-like enzyme